MRNVERSTSWITIISDSGRRLLLRVIDYAKNSHGYQVKDPDIEVALLNWPDQLCDVVLFTDVSDSTLDEEACAAVSFLRLNVFKYVRCTTTALEVKHGD